MDIAEKVKNRPESFVVDETGKPTTVSLPQMQVYDFNKIAYEKVKPMSDADFINDMTGIGLWFSSQQKFRYFLLLGWEDRYFTFFNIEKHNYNAAREALINCVRSLGIPLDINYNHSENNYDFWIRQGDGKAHMYKLFPCNDFVVEA